MHLMYRPRFIQAVVGILVASCLLVACANTSRPGVVGVQRSQFMMISAAQIDRMSAISFEQQAKAAQKKKILITSGPEYERLKTIANRLIPQTAVFRDDTRNWNWGLQLIDSPIVNATCAPGGRITFYTGIINKLNLNDDEIAAIMGHEIAHAVREHGREQVSQALAQNIISNVALAAAGAGSAQSIDAANQIMQYVMVLPNSRQNEREADAIGLELAARGGYDPRAAITLWQKMSKESQGKNPPEFLSTHPSNENRIKELSALIPKVMPLYEAAKRENVTK
ncbi:MULTISPECIES: M48 family metallopeptidase [unclassified Polynucleobacter]|uniref:M48 family metallopeptidase n=1 Tax=unclassified Polynucleobacter TaxID=2640945 RepID=UPI0025722875|nr:MULTISPECIES: M48 family metallopeptidase [unclassified Polynucleobacter]BEI37173.1 M48 family metallopeptidase [Polynucleobacter sp. HIN7]BEI40955.1 M48 family metallopeptidase [Polynucleobacter sp. HIN9]BEI42718.1 M48 family metallopeptidase [Polynucleobacter sp. HIN10]BEI44472.1 M48 family metallopeptidase [Polynucleobacter sp. HIN11]